MEPILKINVTFCLLFVAASAPAQNPYGLQERIPNDAFELKSTSNELASIQLQNAFPNLRFDQALFLTHAGDGSNRIFVVTKRGIVHVFPNDSQVTSADKFLDISARLSGVGETGLLSMAFHPQFAENKKLYISYCDRNLVSIVSEMLVSAHPNQADLASERILLRLQQPQRNHNGGHIAFGPDGYLYIAFGDGHSESASDSVFHGDPLRHGQDLTKWFSDVLRIDVNHKQGNLEYAIPPDNPFAGNGQNWTEETLAYGFRNPWRFSFDRLTGTLWLADVGDKNVEEIDIIESGKNYGWSIKEGKYCFEDAPCDTSLWPLLTDPVFEYHRDAGESVTGGYVYRGEKHPSLAGLYVYGDFNFRKVWALEYNNGVARNVLTLICPQSVSSFGEDEAGEIYAVGYQGSIYRLEDNATAVQEPSRIPAEFRLHAPYPNPFNPVCHIAFEVPSAGQVKIAVFNILGHRVAELVKARYESGRHVVTWNGKDDSGRAVVSGVYVYVMEAAGFKKSGKVLLMK
jgi:glucose/arabinose dehydrogenase